MTKEKLREEWTCEWCGGSNIKPPLFGEPAHNKVVRLSGLKEAMEVVENKLKLSEKFVPFQKIHYQSAISDIRQAIQDLMGK